VREKAVSKLKYLGREAFDALVAALESDNWRVRNWAGHLLGYRGVVAVEPLCQALRKETHSSVRSTIVLSLGSIYSPDAVPALIDALEDENSTVKIHALLGLSYLQDKRAVEPLVHILKSKSQASLRQQAADALLAIDFKAARKVLLRIAEKEQDEFLRSDFLRRAQSKSPPGYSYWPPELLYIHQLVRDAQTLAGEQYGHAEIEQLLEHIDSPYSTVSYDCIFGLGEMRAVSAIPAIIELLERRPGEIGFIALGRMATPEAVQYIAQAVRSEDLARRKAAVRGLASAGRWAVPLLIQLLDDTDLRQAGHYEVPIEGFPGHWPDGHLAHVSLFQCLARAGLQGESKNLATGAHFNVDKEIAEIKKWWARYGQRFLEGKSVPTPKISIVFVMT
jgi:HEAT repeat protein